MIEYVLVGLGVGLIIAIAGAYKDYRYEGFKKLVFMRSPVLGAISGFMVWYWFPDIGLFVVFLATGWTERLSVESWKMIRARVPGKFIKGEWGIVRNKADQF